MNNTVDILVSLGQRLDSFGHDARTERCITEAIAANGWFTREDIMMAVDAIRTEFLQRDKLEAWLGIASSRSDNHGRKYSVGRVLRHDVYRGMRIRSRRKVFKQRFGYDGIYH